MKQFASTTVYEDSLIVICKTDHQLTKTGHCTLEDLNGERYISKGSQSSLHKFLLKQLREPEFMNRQPFVVDNQYSIKEAVAHGLGISIVSELLVKKDLESGYLSKLELDGFTPKRNIQLVYRKDFDSSVVQCVENLMKELDI